MEVQEKPFWSVEFERSQHLKEELDDDAENKHIDGYGETAGVDAEGGRLDDCGVPAGVDAESEQLEPDMTTEKIEGDAEIATENR